MTYRNAQIGWGTKAKLLQRIARRLSMISDRLCCSTTTSSTTEITSTTTTTKEIPI